MSQKRIRRFQIATPSLTGCRDFDYRDLSEFNTDKSDAEDAGYPVKMNDGGYEVSFKCQADNTVTGYVQTLVANVKEVDMATGTEVVTQVTYTFTDGSLTKDLSVPTDGPGEIAVRGVFRLMEKGVAGD